MSNKVGLLLKVTPDVRMKLRVLAMLHSITQSMYVTKFVEDAWKHEPMSTDPRIKKLIKKEVNKNLDTFLDRDLEE